MRRIAPFRDRLAELVDEIEQYGHRVNEVDPVMWVDTLGEGYIPAQVTIDISPEVKPPETETPPVDAPAATPLANGEGPVDGDGDRSDPLEDDLDDPGIVDARYCDG